MVVGLHARKRRLPTDLPPLDDKEEKGSRGDLPVKSGQVFLLAATLIFVIFSSNSTFSTAKGTKDKPKFVTVVLKSIIETNTRSERLQAIHDTWGPAAHALFVAHQNDTYPEAFPLLRLPSTITAEHRLPTFYYSIRKVCEQYDPDFAVFACDHTYLIPEHLVSFLNQLDPSKPLIMGRMLAEKENDPNSILLTPASGLVLSRELMRRVLDQLDKGLKPCTREGKTYWKGKPERALLECVRNLGIFPTDSRDDHQQNRFHSYGIIRVAHANYDGWYHNFHHNFNQMPGFRPFNLVSGPKCCSKETLSFHYVSSHECRALFKIRNQLLANPSMSDEEIKTLLQSEWPREKKQLTEWSGKIKPNDEQHLLPIVQVLRRISDPGVKR